MPLGVAAAAVLVRLLGMSWRLEFRGVREYDRKLAGGARCVFAFWHARLMPLVYTHRSRQIAVLVSHHRDGEWIARLIERLGFATARGSSTRGGEEGVREMLTLARRDHLLAITPDGPRGPAERVKPGLVYLASRTGFPVVPVATAANRSWVFRSWDRFRLPHPFARVVVAYGAPLEVPAELAEDEIERWRVRVEEAIASLTREVAVAAGERT
jgi:lysophospholipid acyltransferase (LPLAT)-like uncharacterized protein